MGKMAVGELHIIKHFLVGGNVLNWVRPQAGYSRSLLPLVSSQYPA